MYKKCSEPGCEGPLIRNDGSGLCQAHKLSSGLSAWEARERVVSFWRSVTGIEPGMDRGEALRRFIVFRDNPTCARCAGDRRTREFCTGRFICGQADEIEEEEVIEDGREVECEETTGYFTG